MIIGPVRYVPYSSLIGAMSATEKRSVTLDTMADYLTAAMRTLGCQRVYRALETVKNMRLSLEFNFERFIVFVTAGFT